MGGHALFVWRRYPPPLFLGGAEISHALLAESLAEAGWTVSYLGSYEDPFPPGADRLTELLEALKDNRAAVEFDDARRTLTYTLGRVSCHAVPQAAIESQMHRLLREGDVTLAVTAQEGSAEISAALAGRTRVVGWLHSVTPTGLEVLAGAPAVALATYDFVAGIATRHAATGTSLHRFYPPFRRPATVEPRATFADAITMVNPIPSKGVAVFLEVARRLADRRFVAQEAWYPVRPQTTSNVEVRAKSPDLDRLISETRLLLVPSAAPEGFGRVVVDFGLRGVPAVVHDIGGLREAAGSSALLLPTLHADDWVTAVASLDDRAAYGAAAEDARSHSARFLRDCVAELSAIGVL